MDLDDLKQMEECYECGCLYIERDSENKIIVSQFKCKKCADKTGSKG